jgi:hypothetical protein
MTTVVPAGAAVKPAERIRSVKSRAIKTEVPRTAHERESTGKSD